MEGKGRIGHETSAPDALAGLIRAAGKRSAPPADAYAAVRAASHASWQAKLRSRRRRRWACGIAASMLVAFGTATLLQWTTTPPAARVASSVAVYGPVLRFDAKDGTWLPIASSGTNFFAGDLIRTEADSGIALRLENGVSLRVTARTELALEAAMRVNLHRGAVYADSDDDQTERQLEVTTPYGIVTDVGTQFEVSTNPDSLRVRVRTGTVQLSESALIDNVSGGPGDEFAVANDGTVQFREISPMAPSWDWVQVLAVAPAANQASLLDYFRWISRETGRRLEFDSTTTELRASLEHLGSDPVDLRPMELLDFIGAASDFSYQMLADGTIRIRRN